MDEYTVINIPNKKKYWLTNVYLEDIIKKANKINQVPKLDLYIVKDEYTSIKVSATLSVIKRKNCKAKVKITRG